MATSPSKHFNKSFNKFILFPIPPSPSRLQTPSTIAVWLFACLTLWILTLPIDFVLDKRLWISWFTWLRFCGRCVYSSLWLWLLFNNESVGYWKRLRNKWRSSLKSVMAPLFFFCLHVFTSKALIEYAKALWRVLVEACAANFSKATSRCYINFLLYHPCIESKCNSIRTDTKSSYLEHLSMLINGWDGCLLSFQLSLTEILQLIQLLRMAKGWPQVLLMGLLQKTTQQSNNGNCQSLDMRPNRHHARITAIYSMNLNVWKHWISEGG